MARMPKNAKPSVDWQFWLQNASDEKALSDGCVPVPEDGEHFIRFCSEFLCHSKGRFAGKPFELLPWQRDLAMRLYGWKRKDGTRRFRKASIWIPKKNGKSTLSAAQCLYALVADGEKGAEVYAAASDRQQASIIFNEAAAMVVGSKPLSLRLQIIKTTKTIFFSGAMSFFRAISADAGRQEGLNISHLAFDELHAQKDRKLMDALRYGGAARTQPMLTTISTAGYDTNSIGYEEYDYARKVANGSVVDTSVLPVIFEATQEDDWTNPDVWAKANPSLGTTLALDDFHADFNAAKDQVSKENAFRRYRLNQWVKSSVRWLPLDAWDRCASDFSESDLEGRECFAGLDLGSVRDTTAFALVFPPLYGEDEWHLLVRFFMPQDRQRKRGAGIDNAPYEQWSREGFCRITPGNVTDYNFVRRQVNEDARRFVIREIAFDRWNSQQLVTQLKDEDGLMMVEFGQGYRSMSGPTKELEKLVMAGKLRHNRNPMLRNQVDAAVVRPDPAENIKPDKEKSTDRIDGVVATCMALGRATVHATFSESLYTRNPILFI